MIRRSDSDAGTTSNRYCERVGLASVPCVEDVLDRDEVNLFHLMVVALLERGRPMAVEEIAERLTVWLEGMLDGREFGRITPREKLSTAGHRKLAALAAKEGLTPDELLSRLISSWRRAGR